MYQFRQNSFTVLDEEWQEQAVGLDCEGGFVQLCVAFERGKIEIGGFPGKKMIS